MRKLLAWTALAIAALWAMKNPAQAAALVHQIGHALAALASQL